MRYTNLKFNGNDRFSIRQKEYFQNLQMYKYHSGTGKNGLYIYSFSLNPEEDQPSGSCNMSRISEQQLYINIYNSENELRKSDKFDLHLYAPNYNVLGLWVELVQLYLVIKNNQKYLYNESKGKRVLKKWCC